MSIFKKGNEVLLAAELEKCRKQPRGKRKSNSIVIMPQSKRNRRPKIGSYAFLRQKGNQMRKRPTAAESVFQRKLQELSIKYIFQYPFLYKGIGGISDFYLPEHKILVEIDGGYHLESNQRQTDAIKDFVCKEKLKKRVLRLTNNQAIYLSIEQIGVLVKNI